MVWDKKIKAVCRKYYHTINLRMIFLSFFNKFFNAPAMCFKPDLRVSFTLLSCRVQFEWVNCDKIKWSEYDSHFPAVRPQFPASLRAKFRLRLRVTGEEGAAIDGNLQRVAIITSIHCAISPPSPSSYSHSQQCSSGHVTHHDSLSSGCSI